MLSRVIPRQGCTVPSPSMGDQVTHADSSRPPEQLLKVWTVGPAIILASIAGDAVQALSKGKDTRPPALTQSRH